jgi:ubiquinone/menaquinone biosynthesis C-methylase UbiE
MDTKINRALLPFTVARIEQEELLDLGVGTPQDVAENLFEMQRINDFLGGTRALTRHLYPRMLHSSAPVTLLDIGTGAAGLPLHLVAWARRHNRSVRVLALDRSARNLRVGLAAAGQWPEIQPVQADAFDLPLLPFSVDYVISTLFLHHLQPGQVQAMLRWAFQIARRGVLMSDLVRGWLPLAAFHAIRPVFARNPLTRHDGALSIRRAYTPAELCDMVSRAGLPDPRVYAHFPWRMTLVVDK